MKKLNITEQLAHSTVRIEAVSATGQVSHGTGFIFQFKIDDKSTLPLIITNKHVLEGMQDVKFVLTKSDSDGNPKFDDHHSVVYKNVSLYYKSHPDPDVDLCALPFAPALNDADTKGVTLFYRVFAPQILPDAQAIADFKLVEDILMVGYPNGIWDHVNNMPVFRKGITATHPALDYKGKKEFMIDAACFPGSSGSPVLAINEGVFTNREGSAMISNQPRVFLLGILYAGPQATLEGTIKVKDIPTASIPYAETKAMINLGLVIKSEQILIFKDMFN